MHAAPPMHTHAPPPAPLGREQAAEQFTRINKGLPDGVHYEPLDEQTLKILRDNGHLPPLSGDTPVQEKMESHHNPSADITPAQMQPAATISRSVPEIEPRNDDEPAKKLKQLIQDSHNARNFYTQLAQSITNNGMHEDALNVFSSMAHDCSEQIKLYSDITRVRFGINFIPADVDIKTNLPLEQALKLATKEENKMIQTLASILHEANDITIERELQYILNKKTVGFHRLLLLNL